jgi:hypothetical protein
LQFDFGRVIGQYLLALGASSDIVREWSRQSPGHLPLDFDALAAENADLVAAQQAGPPNGMDEITKLFWESDFAIARHDAGALLNWWATSLEPLKVRFRDGSGRSLAAAGCYLIELVDANVARACERFSLVTRS